MSAWRRRRRSCGSTATRSPSRTRARSTSPRRATRSSISCSTTWRSRTARCAAPRGRPMALKRFVDGAAGQPFFQKRAPENLPPFIRTATLTFPSGRTADEVVIDDAAGLAWVANLGCIDLNPHPVRAEDLDHPDELRVDLDPVPGRAVGSHPAGGAGRPRIARGGRAGRLAQDVRLAGHPHQRPDRAALDVPGSPPGGAGAGPRRGAPGPRAGHVQVVEGGAPRRLPRLQPEREGPDSGLRVLRPAAARRPRLDPADLGRGPDRRGGGVHHRHRPGPVCGDRRPGAGIDEAVGSLEGLLELSARDEAEGLGDAPWPPNYAKQAGEPPRVQPSRARRPKSEYEPGRGADGGPPPEVAAERAAAVAAGDPNAGLPTEWVGSKPTPTGRRKTSIPVVEISRAEFKDQALEGLDRWKARHPEVVPFLEPADILVDAMRGRSTAWYRVRVNLIHVPEADRPGPGAARERLRSMGGHGHRRVEGGDGRVARPPPGAQGREDDSRGANPSRRRDRGRRSGPRPAADAGRGRGRGAPVLRRDPRVARGRQAAGIGRSRGLLVRRTSWGGHPPRPGAGLPAARQGASRHRRRGPCRDPGRPDRCRRRHRGRRQRPRRSLAATSATRSAIASSSTMCAMLGSASAESRQPGAPVAATTARVRAYVFTASS